MLSGDVLPDITGEPAPAILRTSHHFRVCRAPSSASADFSWASFGRLSLFLWI